MLQHQQKQLRCIGICDWDFDFLNGIFQKKRVFFIVGSNFIYPKDDHGNLIDLC